MKLVDVDEKHASGHTRPLPHSSPRKILKSVEHVIRAKCQIIIETFTFEMSAFPPQRSLASQPVSQDAALKHIQNFLEATTNFAYFRPNARLEPTGPAASEEPSITIHNLKRVEAGLRGEWLEPIIDLKDGGVQIASGIDDGVRGDGDKMDVDGWQDLEEYQREQSIEVGETAPNVVAVDQEGNDVDVHDEETIPQDKPTKKRAESRNVGDEKLDKEARKAAKKLRLKEERRKQEELRRKEEE